MVRLWDSSRTSKGKLGCPDDFREASTQFLLVLPPFIHENAVNTLSNHSDVFFLLLPGNSFTFSLSLSCWN